MLTKGNKEKENLEKMGGKRPTWYGGHYVTRTWIAPKWPIKLNEKVIEVLSVYLFRDYERILKCCENWNETSTPFNAMWISSFVWSKVAWLILLKFALLT